MFRHSYQTYAKSIAGVCPRSSSKFGLATAILYLHELDTISSGIEEYIKVVSWRCLGFKKVQIQSPPVPPTPYIIIDKIFSRRY